MLVLNKKNLIIISVLLVAIMTFIFCFNMLGKGAVGISRNSIKKVIVLDAGHGGVDGGVSGSLTGVKESTLNLKVVKKLEQILTENGFNVVLTRKTEAGLYGLATKNLKRKDMKKRKDIILKAKPDIIISIHMNKYSLSSRRGAQLFYNKENLYSKTLAESIQKSLNQMPEASRECNALSGDYYILNCSDYPSVICECGFLSNSQDESLLITENYQENISYAIYKGVVQYLSSI